MGKYAERTKVPVEQSIKDIRAIVEKYDGGQYQFGMDDDKVVIGFTKERRMVRFVIVVSELDLQERRSALRSLLLVTKAKLEAVASGISIFEDEFMANIVLPNGSLIGQAVRKQIATAYETGEMPNLLPDYTQE